jgi:hypothetical protein
MKHSEKRNRQKSSEGDEENRNLANTPIVLHEVAIGIREEEDLRSI